MAQQTGVVDAISNKFGKFAIKLDGGSTWFSTNPEWIDPKPEKGDTVEFDSGPTGKYLSKCKIVSKGASQSVSGGGTTRAYSKGNFPIDPLDGQRAILRQNAVTNANAYFSTIHDGDPGSFTVDMLLDVARRIEAYTAGDIDREEAEEAVRNMTSTED